VNLEELARAAMIKQASAEPGEAGAYDRFLRHRRRRAWQAAGSAGLAVALVLTLAVGGAWLVGGRHQTTVTGPTTTGMIRYPAQGFALAPPAGWQVDQQATQAYHQVQQQWLVLTPSAATHLPGCRSLSIPSSPTRSTTPAAPGPPRTAFSCRPRKRHSRLKGAGPPGGGPTAARSRSASRTAW
jgi:hypothetical protein